MSYTISFREYPLNIKVIPYVLYGRQVSHSFLALSKDGKTIEELHGMAFNCTSGVYKVCDTRIGQIFNIFARTLPKLRVYMTNKETSYTDSIDVDVSDTLDNWQKCKDVCNMLDHCSIDYKALAGQNCHSTSATVLRCALDIEIQNNPKYEAPGIKNILQLVAR